MILKTDLRIIFEIRFVILELKSSRLLGSNRRIFFLFSPVGLGLLVGDEIHTISVFAAKFIFRKLGVV